MYTHNEDALLSESSRLSPQARVAFATAAASRQLGNYEYYAQRFNPDAVSRPREIAADLWDALQAGPVALDHWPTAVDEQEIDFRDGPKPQCDQGRRHCALPYFRVRKSFQRANRAPTKSE